MGEGVKPWFIHTPPQWLQDHAELLHFNTWNRSLMNLPTAQGVVDIPTALPYITFIPNPIFAKDTLEPIRWTEVAQKLGITGEFIPRWFQYIPPEVLGEDPNTPEFIYPKDLLDSSPQSMVIPVSTLSYIEQHLVDAAYGLATGNLGRDDRLLAEDNWTVVPMMAGLPEESVLPHVMYWPGESAATASPLCVYMDRDPVDGLKVEELIETLDDPEELPVGHVFWDADTTWMAIINPDESGTYVFTATEEAQRALLDPESSKEVHAVRQDQVFTV